MNSIRAFVQHLGQNGKFLANDSLDGASRMDSGLLERGHLNARELLPLFYSSIDELTWVVLCEGSPYAVLGFTLNGNEVYVTLVGIWEGRRFNVATREVMYKIQNYGTMMCLANCSLGTFEWLKRHKATKKVLDRIKVAP